MLFKQIFEKALVDPPVRNIKKSKSFHPSASSIQYLDQETGTVETHGGCLRAEWYRLMEEPPTEGSDAPGIMKMNAGNVLQPMVEHAFKVAGLWRASETSFFHEKMKYSGRVDFWLVDPTQSMGGKEVLMPCEMKTIGKYAEAGCCFPKAGKMMPKTDALLQVVPYIDFYGQFTPNLKLAIFYMGRDGMELGEHHVWLAGGGEYGCSLKDENRYIVVQNETGVYELKHLAVRSIYQRTIELAKYVKAKECPPPSYEDQWDNRRIAAYAEAGPSFGKLNKTECGAVARALKKAEKENDDRINDDTRPLLQKGDWNCRYCSWYTKCRAGLSHVEKPVFRDTGLEELTPAEAPVVEDADAPV
jgi:hypothetical protein